MKILTFFLVLQLTLGISAVNIIHENEDDSNDASNDGEDAYIKENMGLDHVPNGDGLYESDIVFKKETADILYGDGNAKRAAIKIGGSHSFGTLWSGNPPTVPYVISNLLSSYAAAKTAIAAGMNEISSKTCIRFVQRTTQKDYLQLFLNSGCWSYVGKQGGMQYLSLAGGCWSTKTVTHELMHALGFLHEQARPDRDSFVKINYANIKPGMERQFTKYDSNTIDSQREGYDYRSVMHYNSKAFSKNGLNTITRLDDSTQPLGNNVGMTASDQTQLNRLYSCSSLPPTPTTTTLSPGTTLTTPSTRTTIISTQTPTTTISTTRRRRIITYRRRRIPTYRRRRIITYRRRRIITYRRRRIITYRRRRIITYRRRRIVTYRRRRIFTTRRRFVSRRRFISRRRFFSSSRRRFWGKRDEKQEEVANEDDNDKKDQLSQTVKNIISELDENQNQKDSDTQNNEKSNDLSEIEDKVEQMVLKKLSNDEEMEQGDDETEENDGDNIDINEDELVNLVEKDLKEGHKTDAEHNDVETNDNQKDHVELLAHIKDEVMKLIHEKLNDGEDETAAIEKENDQGEENQIKMLDVADKNNNVGKEEINAENNPTDDASKGIDKENDENEGNGVEEANDEDDGMDDKQKKEYLSQIEDAVAKLVHEKLNERMSSSSDEKKEKVTSSSLADANTDNKESEEKKDKVEKLDEDEKSKQLISQVKEDVMKLLEKEMNDDDDDEKGNEETNDETDAKGEKEQFHGDEIPAKKDEKSADNDEHEKNADGIGAAKKDQKINAGNDGKAIAQIKNELDDEELV